MTYNAKSKTMSTRIDPGALAVLEWHAHLVRVPLRRWLRELLEQRAEEITREYDLDLAAALPEITAPPELAVAVLDAEDQLAALPPMERRQAFVDRLADALDMDPAAVDALVDEDDRTYTAVVDGITFTDQPVTIHTGESHH